MFVRIAVLLSLSLLLLVSPLVKAADEISLVSAMSRTYAYRQAQGQEAKFRIKVANLSPEKFVALRYLGLDGQWRDVPASFTGVSGDGKELWEVTLSLCTVTNTWGCDSVNATDLHFAVFMRANNQEYWDSRSGANYFIGKDDGYWLAPTTKVTVLSKGELHCSATESTCDLWGGQILLQNIAPQKNVRVVYTQDNWRSASEIEAQFFNAAQAHPLSRFTNPGVQGGELWWFSIADLPHEGVDFKYFVKYTVAGQTYYANNFQQDYRLGIPDFPAVYLLGTHNSWQVDYPNMTKNTRFNGDSYWIGTAEFAGHIPFERFKFDIDAINNPWFWSYGDDDNDGRNWQGIAERGAGDIKILGGPGYYQITLEDDTHAYRVEKLPGDHFYSARTLIFFHADLADGEQLYLRGGIDWQHALQSQNIDCAQDESAKWLCAVPLRHRLLAEEPSRAFDTVLDWHGAEVEQGDVAGTPLIWTTNNPAYPTTVATDNEGYTPLNRWGDNYWMLDADIYCDSLPADAKGRRWVELKGFIANGEGWEADIHQPGAPYNTANHFAECGKINVFRFGENEAVIKALY